jgi:hypothetical protein
MVAPYVLMKRWWYDDCQKIAGGQQLNKVFEEGANPYTKAQAEADNNLVCYTEAMYITNIVWDSEYGSYGRMAITIASDCCDNPDSDCYIGCVCSGGNGMLGKNHFYLSPDGTTEGTQSAEIIISNGTIYIVAAQSDLPPISVPVVMHHLRQQKIA